MAYRKVIILSTLILFAPLSGNSQGKSCLACRFNMSTESAKAGQANPCDDLFGASCVGTDGKSKYSGASKNLTAELSKPIREARNKTVQAMGYKDIDDAVKAKLKEAGIIVKEPPDQDTWKNLIGEGDESWTSVVGSKLYASADQCDKDVKELQAIQYYSMTDASALNEVATKYESFVSRYREQSVKFYAKDIPNFVSNHIGQKCSQLKSNSPNYKPEENQEIVKACKNLGALKRKGVELFRAEGTADYERLAEQFVRENLLPELKFSYQTSSSPTTPAPEKSDADKARERIQALDISVSNYCFHYSSTIENAGKKVVVDFMKTVSKSKTTVDAVIDSVYSKEKEKLANEIFQTARSDIQDLTKSFVKDPKKRGEILDGYDGLKLFWMKKPDDAAYIKDKNGTLVLDESKAVINPADQTSSIFFDPNLSFFKTMNAFYTPSVSYGKMKTDEQVNMMPAFISMLEKNPYAYMTVVAHEAGHKIGPMVSKINGYDLSSEYRELLACYKDNKSIKLEDNQGDETMSDYFSSEVLARQIQKLPEEKRKQAVMSAMLGYCMFDESQEHSFSCKGNHPENSLRVSGIFGANPSIRKILGCSKDSPKFRTCGLKTSILDLSEESKTAIGTSGDPAKDTKEIRGVQ